MISKIYYPLFFLFLLYGCAKQTAPTGGPKDEDPPTIINTNPEDQSLNFSGNTIIMSFNEDVKLNNPRQQILITPRLEQEIIYNYRRNRVIIEFSEPLDSSTTYSFNFREAIQDITESNPADIKFAFSTGSYIDSLNVRGNVYDLIDAKPLKNILVALQEPVDTTHYFMVPPMYFTKTEKDGSFSFSNLKASTYRLYAFADANNDLILQPSREKHGFLPEPLILNSDTSNLQIPLILNNTDTLKIISARQSGRYFDINFNKYITDYHVNLKANDSLSYMLSGESYIIRIFNISTIQDPVNIEVTATDSLQQIVNSEITVEYEPTVRQPIDFSMKTGDVRIIKSSPSFSTEIKFNKPIRNVTIDSLYFFSDSLNIIPFTRDNYSFDSSRTKLTINYSLDPLLFQELESKNNTSLNRDKSQLSNYLYLGKGAFISVENDSSNHQEIKAKIYDQSSLAILHVAVDVPYNNFIVELTNNRREVIERRYNQTEIRFDNLSPVTYYLRVLEDDDGDKIWEPGNIFLNIAPDDVLYYINPENKQEVILRANFEVGPYLITPVNNQAENVDKF